MQNAQILHSLAMILENIMKQVPHLRCMEHGILRPMSQMLKTGVSAVQLKSFVLLTELTMTEEAHQYISHVDCLHSVVNSMREYVGGPGYG